MTDVGARAAHENFATANHTLRVLNATITAFDNPTMPDLKLAQRTLLAPHMSESQLECLALLLMDLRL